MEAPVAEGHVFDLDPAEALFHELIDIDAQPRVLPTAGMALQRHRLERPAIAELHMMPRDCVSLPDGGAAVGWRACP